MLSLGPKPVLLIFTATIFAMTLATVVLQWGPKPMQQTVSKSPGRHTASLAAKHNKTRCKLDVLSREEVQTICSASVPTPRCRVEHTDLLKPAGLGPSTLRLPSGQSMKIFLTPVVEGMAAHIATNGIWERESVSLVMSALRALPMGKTALIDVGCNFGVYTLAAASLGHRVVAIDANYHLAMRVRKSVEENSLRGSVDVFWNAMSAQRTNVKMRHSGSCDFGMLQTYKSSQGVTWGGDPVLVPGIGLDDVIVNNDQLSGIENLVIKVDIEGSEWNVFATAAGTFDRFNVSLVLMEWEWTVANFPQKTQLLCSFFTSRGFSAYAMVGGRLGAALQVSERLRWPPDVLWLSRSGLVVRLAA